MFRRLPLYAWPVMFFLAGVVVRVPGTAVRVVGVLGLALVYVGTVSQVMLTERNADAQAALAHRPLLDVDELGARIALDVVHRISATAAAAQTSTVEVPTNGVGTKT